MKVNITKRQMLAIQEVSETLNAMIGCSTPENDEDNFDSVIMKELKFIQRFFKKNGYELSLNQ